MGLFGQKAAALEPLADRPGFLLELQSEQESFTADLLDAGTFEARKKILEAGEYRSSSNLPELVTRPSMNHRPAAVVTDNYTIQNCSVFPAFCWA